MGSTENVGNEGRGRDGRAKIKVDLKFLKATYCGGDDTIYSKNITTKIECIE